jgi:L-asparaginase
MKSKILLIYTGGTIGSFEDAETQSLKPVNFDQLYSYIPELKIVDADIIVEAFAQPKDSSDMHPDDWIKLVEIIEKNYELVDGFVVLHGTDTMAYTASALSFMIQNLSKPIVFTGSQLPIGKIRTDGKENLITAIEIAATKKNNQPLVPEVCIYFEYKLYRANRTFKFSANHFNAYLSPNYPVLADAGVNIEFNEKAILSLPLSLPVFNKKLDSSLAVFTLFPGFSKVVFENILNTPGLRALIIETYGFGNGPLLSWFFELINDAQRRGIVIINITQCPQGAVQMGKYQTSKALKDAGVCGGADITRESAVTKLMHLLANYTSPNKVKEAWGKSISGEVSL